VDSGSAWVISIQSEPEQLMSYKILFTELFVQKEKNLKQKYTAVSILARLFLKFKSDYFENAECCSQK